MLKYYLFLTCLFGLMICQISEAKNITLHFKNGNCPAKYDSFKKVTLQINDDNVKSPREGMPTVVSVSGGNFSSIPPLNEQTGQNNLCGGFVDNINYPVVSAGNASAKVSWFGIVASTSNSLCNHDYEAFINLMNDTGVVCWSIFDSNN